MTAKQKANRERFKKVVAEAKKLRKKNPKLTQAQAVKQAWAIMYSKKTSKVGATKKAKQTKVKAKKSKRTSEMHTDTKSHNVNIKVVSGVSGFAKTQAGAIQRILMKKTLRMLGYSVPAEISNNDLSRLYKTITGKKAPSLSKIKKGLNK